MARAVLTPGSGTLTARIDKDGDWFSLERFLQITTNPRALKRDIVYSYRDFLRSYQWWAIKGLISEGSAINQNWEPTSRPLISTGIRTTHLLRSMERMKISISNDQTKISFQRGDLFKKSHKGGTIMSRYLSYFEYGRNMGQPPRPLFSAAWEKAGGNKRIYNNMLKAIKKHYNSNGVYNIEVKFA